MLIGLINTPATFMIIIDDIFKPLLYNCTLTFLDDILMHSKDEETHYKDLRKVFLLIHKHKLYAKRSKYKFNNVAIWCSSATNSTRPCMTSPVLIGKSKTQ